MFANGTQRLKWDGPRIMKNKKIRNLTYSHSHRQLKNKSIETTTISTECTASHSQMRLQQQQYARIAKCVHATQQASSSLSRNRNLFMRKPVRCLPSHCFILIFWIFHFVHFFSPSSTNAPRTALPRIRPLRNALLLGAFFLLFLFEKHSTFELFPCFFCALFVITVVEFGLHGVAPRAGVGKCAVLAARAQCLVSANSGCVQLVQFFCEIKRICSAAARGVVVGGIVRSTLTPLRYTHLIMPALTVAFGACSRSSTATFDNFIHQDVIMIVGATLVNCQSFLAL